MKFTAYILFTLFFNVFNNWLYYIVIEEKIISVICYNKEKIWFTPSLGQLFITLNIILYCGTELRYSGTSGYTYKVY